MPEWESVPVPVERVWEPPLSTVSQAAINRTAASSKPTLELWGGRRLLIVALALAALGLGIEFVQSVVGREFSLADGAANTLGVFMGILLGRLIRLVLQLSAPTT